MRQRTQKGKERRKLLEERVKDFEKTTSNQRKDMHGRNMQLSQHKICAAGNKLINSIIEQVFYGKGNDPGDTV